MRRAVKSREDTVSGLMFPYDFVGIVETPEGLQKQIEGARMHKEMKNDDEHDTCSVLVCSEDG